MNHEEKMETYMVRIASALERLATCTEEHNKCVQKAIDPDGPRIPVNVNGEMRSVT